VFFFLPHDDEVAMLARFHEEDTRAAAPRSS